MFGNWDSDLRSFQHDRWTGTQLLALSKGIGGNTPFLTFCSKNHINLPSMKEKYEDPLIIFYKKQLSDLLENKQSLDLPPICLRYFSDALIKNDQTYITVHHEEKKFKIFEETE